MLTLKDDHVPSKHLDEMPGFLALDHSHLDSSATQLLVVNPGRVNGAGPALVNGAALALPEVDDLPAFPVAVEDDVAVARVEKPVVSPAHLHQLHVLHSPHRLTSGPLIRHKSTEQAGELDKDGHLIISLIYPIAAPADLAICFLASK